MNSENINSSLSKQMVSAKYQFSLVKVDFPLEYYTYCLIYCISV